MVAQGDRAKLVDAVRTDAVLDGSELSRRLGLDPGGESLGAGTASKRAVGPRLVVVETNGIELSSEISTGAARGPKVTGTTRPVPQQPDS